MLVDIVARVLDNDVAHDGLLRPMLDSGRVGELSEFELDLGDWGFTYGVAWAIARTQNPDESDHSVAERALVAAGEVFREYCIGGEQLRAANGNGAPRRARD